MAGLDITALGPGGAHRSIERTPLTEVTGAVAGELSRVPPLYVSRAMAALRAAATLPVDERITALARAGELFATGTVAGMSAATYQRAVSRISGTPITSVGTAMAGIRAGAELAYRNALAARPIGAVGGWREPAARSGSAVWIRRGATFAVHAAGNHPGVHAQWLEALALGYRVAVRPSSREPLTPYRLVSALRAAGFGDDRVMLLPTDHRAADVMLSAADLGMVYGGQAVVGKYAADPTVLPNGPGRSKILITADSDWRAHIDVIVESVAGDGGVGCINTTAVFVEGDPAPLAAALAERLAELPSLPPDDAKAVLPVHRRETAVAISDHLRAKASGTTAWLGGDGVADDLGDGTAALRPAVHQLADPYAGQAGIELPFPCVWVAPWDRRAGSAVLGNSLVLTAITQDAALLDELQRDPSIRNLYIGPRPTPWMAPGVPHDGYLGEFLMRSKGVSRVA